MQYRLLFLALILCCSTAAFALDWPQWRGPHRDGMSKETGLLKSWPANGPKVLWRTPVGEGYSGVSVSNGRLYTMDAKNQGEWVVSVDLTTGREVWRTKIGINFTSGQGNGPRSTPTVDGEWVYALGASGMLVALGVKDGKQIWSHDLRSKFGSEIPQWGTSTSPLVEGNLLLVNVGGKSGYALVAFNKRNGTVVWNSHTDRQGYSSPIAITVDGIRQILFFTGTSLVSVSPEGKISWKYPWRTSYDANIATPVFIPPNRIFISSGYDVGAAVLKIGAGGGASVFQEIWKNKVMQNHFNSSVFHQGYLYGFDNAILKCVEAATSQEKWKISGLGKGSLILADGHLIVLSDRGILVSVEATPTQYKEKARAQMLTGTTWTVPTLADGKLYLRSQKEIAALDFTAPK